MTTTITERILPDSLGKKTWNNLNDFLESRLKKEKLEREITKRFLKKSKEDSLKEAFTRKIIIYGAIGMVVTLFGGIIISWVLFNHKEHLSIGFFITIMIITIIGLLLFLWKYDVLSNI